MREWGNETSTPWTIIESHQSDYKVIARWMVIEEWSGRSMRDGGQLWLPHCMCFKYTYLIWTEHVSRSSLWSSIVPNMMKVYLNYVILNFKKTAFYSNIDANLMGICTVSGDKVRVSHSYIGNSFMHQCSFPPPWEFCILQKIWRLEKRHHALTCMSQLPLCLQGVRLVSGLLPSPYPNSPSSSWNYLKSGGIPT